MPCTLRPLNPSQQPPSDYIEEAEALSDLMQRCGLSQKEVAARMGMSQSTVANKLRLLRLSPALLAQLREHHLSERHARALLRLPTEEERFAVLSVMVLQRLTVAGAEEYIELLLQNRREPPTAAGLQGLLQSLSCALEQAHAVGIAADTSREETETEIVLTIRLPKQTA